MSSSFVYVQLAYRYRYVRILWIFDAERSSRLFLKNERTLFRMAPRAIKWFEFGRKNYSNIWYLYRNSAAPELSARSNAAKWFWSELAAVRSSNNNPSKRLSTKFSRRPNRYTIARRWGSRGNSRVINRRGLATLCNRTNNSDARPRLTRSDAR